METSDSRARPERLCHLARAMPPVARAITAPDAKTPPEDDPAVLLAVLPAG